MQGMMARAVETMSRASAETAVIVELDGAERTAMRPEMAEPPVAVAVVELEKAMALAQERRYRPSVVILEPETPEFRDLVALVAQERRRVGLPERD